MSTTETQSSNFETLLKYLKHNRGTDFMGYKRSSLVRRVHRHMQTLGVTSYNELIDYLEVHPDEFTFLFNTILINVTSFFRDPEAWNYISQFVVPRILETKVPDAQVRIWSAGCASGEEAYTIAMLLAEQLGLDQYKQRVKVYATDLDEDALNKARLAVYSETELEGVPPELIAKYIEKTGSRFTFIKDLRRCVIFGRHDLMKDAPISRIDLLICRNILMYFNSETQTRILARLNYSLAQNGFLFLGKAEMLLTQMNLFSAVDLKNHIYAKVQTTNFRDRLLIMSQNGMNELQDQVYDHVRLRDSAFDSIPVAEVVVDANGALTLINERARALFSLSQRDLGKLFQDFEFSYRPAELRSSIELAYARNTDVTLKDVELSSLVGEGKFLDILLCPLSINGSGPLGISISFFDVTEHKHLQIKLERAYQELETAMEELQSTNEELETTNEELQSTNEELESTNEELQSTVEELETTNEELQSTNEELHAVNEVINQRSAELNMLNAFLESILVSLRGGVVVINAEMNVQIWNQKSEDLWGLRSDEVAGQNLFSLDFGLPVDQLRKTIRTLLNGEMGSIEMELNATNRRGRSITCQVSCTPLLNSQKETVGVILVCEQKNSMTE